MPWIEKGSISGDYTWSYGFNQVNFVVTNTEARIDAGRFTHKLSLNTSPGKRYRVIANIVFMGRYFGNSIDFTTGDPAKSIRLYDRDDGYGQDLPMFAYLSYQEWYEPQPALVPASISIPTTIHGGKNVAISWGVSTRATRYHLERSLNNGSWTQLYSGGLMNFTDTIPKEELNGTVSYRVRGYNVDGYSGYRQSSIVTVINNMPPTVPEEFIIGKLYANRDSVISWTESTDFDEDNITYYLERSIDGGGYVAIYNGTSNSFSDLIDRGKLTVRYKVRAYDGKVYSGFLTSALHNIRQFPDMKFRVGSTLHTTIDGWTNIDGELKKITDIKFK